MKVLSFGSCMASNVANSLVHDFQADWRLSLGHNRSDTFLAYYVRKSYEPLPRADLDGVLMPKEGFADNCKLILDNQYPETMGRSGTHENKRETGREFLAALSEEVFDLVILDNFMDIVGLTMIWTGHPTHPCSPVFFNSNFYANDAWVAQQFTRSCHLTALESAANWLEIVKWIRDQQRTAAIVFLCFPHSKIVDAPDRIALARDFCPAFEALCVNQDVTIIPPLALRPELSGDPADWTHFAPAAYRALAGHVVLLTGQKTEAAAPAPKPA